MGAVDLDNDIGPVGLARNNAVGSYQLASE